MRECANGCGALPPLWLVLGPGSGRWRVRSGAGHEIRTYFAIRRALNINPPPPHPPPPRPSGRLSLGSSRRPLAARPAITGTPAPAAVRRPSAGDRPATGRPPGARDRLTTDHTSGSAPPETDTRVARCRVPTARCAREPRVRTANPNRCARPRSASLDVWRAPHRRKMVDAKLLTASSSTSFGLSCKQ